VQYSGPGSYGRGQQSAPQQQTDPVALRNRLDSMNAFRQQQRAQGSPTPSFANGMYPFPS
jgi:hypothetical protein